MDFTSERPAERPRQVLARFGARLVVGDEDNVALVVSTLMPRARGVAASLRVVIRNAEVVVRNARRIVHRRVAGRLGEGEDGKLSRRQGGRKGVG